MWIRGIRTPHEGPVRGGWIRNNVSAKMEIVNLAWLVFRGFAVVEVVVVVEAGVEG